jgi:serine/threonine protein phosphatase PrpC/LysM repeat protein
VDENIKLSATVISCMGNDSDKDDFYFNGNFSNCHNTESIQCSFEKSSNNFIFAVSDSIGIDKEGSDGISAVREVKRYHESAKKQQFSLESITEKIYEAVQLSSNLIYSKSIVANQNSSILTGFSSVIIDNNRAVIMNLGNNGVFLFRQGGKIDIFAQNGSRKNEKLKMLGISPNTGEMYNDTESILKKAEEESKTKVKLSSSFELEEGDIIILCSDGLLNGTGKNRIEAVINSGFDCSKMASILFQEAVKNGSDDSVTILAIQVDEIRNISYTPGIRRFNQVDFENEQEEDEKGYKKDSNIINYILAFVCVLIISGILFMFYLIYSSKDNQTASNPSLNISQSSLASNNSAQSTDSLFQNETPGDSSADTSTAQSSASSNAASDNTDKKDAETGNQGNTGTTGNENESSEYDIYIVKSGDTLSSISSKYYGNPNKYDQIIKYNNLKNENDLYIDQKLKIPKQN